MKGRVHSEKWEPRQESDLFVLSLDRRLERAALPVVAAAVPVLMAAAAVDGAAAAEIGRASCRERV